MSLHAPLQLNNAQQVLEGSVGISIYPDDGDTAELLLKRADMAMNRAKAGEKNNKTQYYLHEMQSLAEDRILLEKHFPDS